MLEQILLILALIGCLALLYRRLRPAAQGSCHSGACECPADRAPSAQAAGKLTQIMPRTRN
ncbi:MAG TPA: hypothetical protein VFD58_35955 [Blastocatellia bacterium]|nr:hypothetical protein [Blastocatellia bacterium]